MDRLQYGSQTNLYFYDFEGTDYILKDFRGQQNHRAITMELCDITTHGVALLRTLPNLEVLDIEWGCRGINDEAVGQIGKMKQLKQVKIVHFTGSDAAIENLRKALPDCDVSVSRPPPVQ